MSTTTFLRAASTANLPSRTKFAIPFIRSYIPLPLWQTFVAITRTFSANQRLFYLIILLNDPPILASHHFLRPPNPIPPILRATSQLMSRFHLRPCLMRMAFPSSSHLLILSMLPMKPVPAANSSVALLKWMPRYSSLISMPITSPSSPLLSIILAASVTSCIIFYLVLTCLPVPSLRLPNPRGPIPMTSPTHQHFLLISEPYVHLPPFSLMLLAPGINKQKKHTDMVNPIPHPLPLNGASKLLPSIFLWP